MGSRRSNPSVKPGQKNPIDSNTIRSSSLRDYTPRVVKEGPSFHFLAPLQGGVLQPQNNFTYSTGRIVMGVTFWGNFASGTLLVPFHWRFVFPTFSGVPGHSQNGNPARRFTWRGLGNPPAKNATAKGLRSV